MGKELLLSSLAFGLFVVCPRMAGMMHVIAGQESLSMMKTVLVGTAFSVPLLMLMVMVFGRFGVWGALTVCVLTDFGAALIMGSVSAKAGVETAVIALFVIMGVKVAPFISRALF
ncbi:MAG: hypothetical protein PHU72_05410 [Dethiosulfovibrio sp.]|nr:hypothetical protein [Dethiosulfovibrio sp.]